MPMVHQGMPHIVSISIRQCPHRVLRFDSEHFPNYEGVGAANTLAVYAPVLSSVNAPPADPATGTISGDLTASYDAPHGMAIHP